MIEEKEKGAIVEDNLPAESSRGALQEAVKSEAVERIQASLVIAKKFPRDETAAITKIRTSCKRITLADQALYSYPRGKKRVTGPSIRLAEVLAQNWGNIDFGIKEIENHAHATQGYSVVEAFAWDLESNTKQSKTFVVKHKMQLKDGRTKFLTDPRDIYELVANQGARRMRACILGVIPGDITDYAVAECRKTLETGDGTPIKDRINQMTAYFSDFGVSQTMLESRLGHEMKLTTAQEIVELKSIYLSIRDGQSKREDWFSLAQEREGGKAEEVNKRFSKGKGKQTDDGNSAEGLDK